MQIQKSKPYNTSPTFRGYAAQPLRGLFLRKTEIPGFDKIAKQLEQIGNKQGFEVFVQTNENIVSKNLDSIPNDEFIRGDSKYIWCQDNITFLPNKNFISNPNVISKFSYDIEKFFGFKNIKTRQHIPGGNYFVIDNYGKRELLLGYFHMGDLGRLAQQLRINSIRLIPQADFHLDLFIRPLKNKTVLIADDKMWFNRVNQVIGKMKKNKSLKTVYDQLIKVKNKLRIMNLPLKTPYCRPSTVEEELNNLGYQTVKVPGRIFEYKNDADGILPNHLLNYMNSIVHINPKGELVYITNKSDLNNYCGITPEIAKEINFDFETEFINSVKDHIKPENIYFTDTDKLLKKYEGGIHCLCAEIPKSDNEINIRDKKLAFNNKNMVSYYHELLWS